MVWTSAESSDEFPHWERNDENIWKIVQTEACGALSTLLSDKVTFKDNINNLFSV